MLLYLSDIPVKAKKGSCHVEVETMNNHEIGTGQW